MRLVIILLCLSALLSSCGSATSPATPAAIPAPIGVWVSTSSTLKWTFSADKTYIRVDTADPGSTTPASGTYAVDGKGVLDLDELVADGGGAGQGHLSVDYQFGNFGADPTHMLFGAIIYTKQ